MSALTCSSCEHAQYLASIPQTVCLHPNVATPSLVVPSRIVGLDADTCRYSKTSCGPTARWWTAVVTERQRSAGER